MTEPTKTEQKIDHLKFQYLPIFPEFQGGVIDEQGKYQEPNTERAEEINNRLDELGEIMEGADFEFWLDGAINISLIQGKYIRDHKDVDISITQDNLPDLEKQLKAKGYVIVYANREKNTATQRCWETVGASEIISRNLKELLLVKVDESGKIQDTDDVLNFVDLHVHRQDEEENLIISYSGAVIPRHYCDRYKTHTTKSGHKIPVSHPVLVAYHKAEQGRDYDFTDIAHLRNNLSEEDRDFLVAILEAEPQYRIERYKPFLSSVFDRINIDMSEDEIKQLLMEYPVFATFKAQDANVARFIEDFPNYYKAHPHITADEFIDYLFTTTKIKEKLQQNAQDKIDKLRKAFGEKG